MSKHERTVAWRVDIKVVMGTCDLWGAVDAMLSVVGAWVVVWWVESKPVEVGG